MLNLVGIEDGHRVAVRNLDNDAFDDPSSGKRWNDKEEVEGECDGEHWTSSRLEYLTISINQPA